MKTSKKIIVVLLNAPALCVLTLFCCAVKVLRALFASLLDVLMLLISPDAAYRYGMELNEELQEELKKYNL